MSRVVAILCAAPRSIYHTLPNVEVFDRNRDASTFTGGMPIVAHPPCRSWSAYYAHQAKPEPGERELGIWCVDQVRQWGGVIEQPAHSRLWEVAGLPRPGKGLFTGDCQWSTEVWQAWWGYPMRKATWLFFSGISPLDVHYPLRLHPQGSDKRREQVMSKQQRSATTPEFAKWLVDIARQSTVRRTADLQNGEALAR